MRKSILTLAITLISVVAMSQSKVYFTRDISPESLLRIYEALGVKPQGHVAVKISSGEGGNKHYLKPTSSASWWNT